MRDILFYSLSILTFFPIITNAQFGENVEFLGNSLLTGTYYDVAVSGNYAYVADSYGITIFDVSDPDTLVVLSNIATPGSSRTLSVSGNYVYIGDELYGLIAVNVSNPLSPEIAAAFPLGYYQLPDIFIQGNLLYLTARSAGLFVFDITNPSSPALTGHFTAGDLDAYGIWVADSLAYIADFENGLLVVNVASSDNIFEINELELPDQVVDVQVQGTYAYVAASDSGMRIVDISNLNDLQEVGAYNIGFNSTFELLIQDTIAYITYTAAGLHLVNISDPENPTNLSTILSNNAHGIYWSNPFIYLADIDLGLRVLDITVPSLPLQRAHHTPDPKTALGVYKSGNVAYVTGERTLLSSLEVTNPANPTITADRLWPGSTGVNMVVQDTLAFIAGHHQGLQIVSVADPTDLYLVGVYNTPGTAYGIDIQGDYAFVADGDSGLRIIDISNPAFPNEIGHYDSVQTIRVDVDGNYAYLIHPNFGLYILEISDPAHPFKLSQLALTGWSSDIQVVGDLAYLACNDLSVINVADRTQPHQIAQRVFFGGPRAVFVERNYAYLLTDYGLFIADVADTNHIIQVGSYNTPGYGYDIFVENSTIYVADYYHLGIYRFTASSVIEHEGEELLSRTFLYQNYPNPFNPITAIKFDLPKTSKVSLKIYTILGEEVTTLVSAQLPPGQYSYLWDAHDLASGVYFYKLDTAGFIQTRTMVLIR
jgi:hypothetical protein